MAEGLVLGVITPPCSVMYIGQLINIIWLCTVRQWPLEAVAHWGVWVYHCSSVGVGGSELL